MSGVKMLHFKKIDENAFRSINTIALLTIILRYKLYYWHSYNHPTGHSAMKGLKGVRYTDHYQNGALHLRDTTETDLDRYPFHIKPKCRVKGILIIINAAWCECSKAVSFDSGIGKAAFNMWGLLLPREVFWKHIVSESQKGVIAIDFVQQ